MHVVLREFKSPLGHRADPHGLSDRWGFSRFRVGTSARCLEYCGGMTSVLIEYRDRVALDSWPHCPLPDRRWDGRPISHPRQNAV